MITNRSYVIIWPERERVWTVSGSDWATYNASLFRKPRTYTLEQAERKVASMYKADQMKVITLDEFETLRMLAAP